MFSTNLVAFLGASPFFYWGGRCGSFIRWDVVVMCSCCANRVRLQCPQGVSFKAAWLAQVTNGIPPLVFD